MELWEFHPTLIHFPIAFLIAAVCYDFYLWSRGDYRPSTVVNGLYITGVLTAAVAAAAGALAFFTAPASFTEEAADMMWWHIGGAVTQFVLFAIIAIVRFRHRRTDSPSWTRILGLVATLVLIFAGYEGGYMVYHGATGIEPGVLARDLRAKQERKTEMAAKRATGDRETTTR
ncbi:MAG TPA: DUF2231 domain-containing protein [Pirellulales bacterium]|nr:DUF2231 domain-containing protein [Pirellulales bacterium]